ncbi:MAG TPA: histidine triad nucleotide-binding protein [Rhodocyclaceae bacterium]|nr:histidine triad nucleotide-binding protein [Rhodocyclaceae bacterium]HNH34678.1 histidine triad nucleotide-binding protein [Rhodocyclaceae bacterium]
MSDCIFCRIVKGEIPSRKIYEDEDLYAFHDIHPSAPVHFMIIPKLHVPSLMEVRSEHQAVLGKILLKADELARGQGLNDGFRVIINTGRIGRQEVYHLHVHIVGGPEPLGSMVPRKPPQPAQ